MPEHDRPRDLSDTEDGDGVGVKPVQEQGVIRREGLSLTKLAEQVIMPQEIEVVNQQGREHPAIDTIEEAQDVDARFEETLDEAILQH